MSQNKDYTDPEKMKKNWRFVVGCVLVIGFVLYLWLRWNPR
jgi:hypothetical protein